MMSTTVTPTTVRPICFMVMPFGTKDSGITDGSAPAKINFDTLWHKAVAPAMEGLGFVAIRADQDLGSLIIQEMLERLALADLVVADLTIPNGNVYYEVGIRHATRELGCVLIAADWAKPLFDGQIAALLPLARRSDPAGAIRASFADVRALADGTTTPYCLPDYPDLDPQERAIPGVVEQPSASGEVIRATAPSGVGQRSSTNY